MFARKQIFLLTVATLWVACPWLAFGQFRDSFEGGQPRWQIGREDVAPKIVSQMTSAQLPHNGQSCERLELTCKQGTSLHLVYEIPPTTIHEGLKASLWLRSASSGIRPAFRVVFPWTAHPVTGNQLTIYLWGKPSRLGGQWTEVTLENPERELIGQTALLRGEYGFDIDLRDPMIDGVVLDVYRGPGVVRIDIDDLSIDGMIDANAADTAARQSIAKMPTTSEEIQQQLQERLHDLQRGIPHWLQYRGESLEWLKTMGVTGVVLDAPQSLEWLRSANQAGLQVLSPPPAATPPQNEWPAYDAVNGWLLGSALDLSHVERSQELSQRLTQFPTALLRPMFAEAMENHWGYSRIADLLAVPSPLPSTVRDGQEMTETLKVSYDRARGRTVPLTSLSIQPTPEWLEQDRALKEAIGSENIDLPRFDILQARLSYYRCIAAGARGWYLRSQTSLDSGDEADLLRASTIRALAAESEWLAPWIQNAAAPIPLPNDSIPGYRGTLHPLTNSQLLLLIAAGEHDALCAMPPRSRTLNLELPGLNPQSQAFRITHGRLEPALSQKGPQRAEIAIDRPGFVELVVITSDAKVINYLQQRSNEAARGLFDIQSQIANSLDRLANTSLVAERTPPNDPAWRAISDAKSAVRASDQLASRGNLAAAAASAEQAAIALQEVVRASWLRGLASFPSPQSSPWLENAFGLPSHWQLSRILSNRSWQPLNITGWNDPQFRTADWNGMEQLGWSLDRRLLDEVDAQLQIGISGNDGQKTMALRAVSRQGVSIPGGFGGSSLRLTSPAMDVAPASLFRIDGMVRVIRASQSAQAGLLIYDNIGGPAAGNLFRLPSTAADPWQRVTLFRMMPNFEGARIMFELRGEGEFEVRDLQIASIMPAAASQSPTPARQPRVSSIPNSPSDNLSTIPSSLPR